MRDSGPTSLCAGWQAVAAGRVPGDRQREILRNLGYAE
jgi:hypothetical protein